MNELLTPVRTHKDRPSAPASSVRPIVRDDSPDPPCRADPVRKERNMFEDAKTIRSLVDSCRLTQEKIAKRLSVSQSYVANKLRLLRFSEEERRIILDSALTERHARAALRLTDPKRRIAALREMINKKMNVASAEEYVEALLCSGDPLPIHDGRPPEGERRGAGKFELEFKRRLLLRDMRIFYNSIDHAVESVRSCGFDVSSTRTRTDGGVVITITVKNCSP
ncbi:MAG: hypothetical protein IKG80_06955 [Clostridia bacterium]|nr:hypothetical protein [Clostridia bacterium]